MNLINIFFIILGLIIFWFIFSFNSFIRKKNQVNQALADIEVQLKRRYDLIPNLIEIVKGYAIYEKEVFEKVTEARTNAISAQTVKEHSLAENMLSQTLKSLFAVAENYPELKASQNFLELQKELTDTEDKIQAARRFYNNVVMDFNIKIESFPSNIIALIFNFKKFDFFELEEQSQKELLKIKF